MVIASNFNSSAASGSDYFIGGARNQAELLGDQYRAVNGLVVNQFSHMTPDEAERKREKDERAMRVVMNNADSVRAFAQVKEQALGFIDARIEDNDKLIDALEKFIAQREEALSIIRAEKTAAEQQREEIRAEMVENADAQVATDAALSDAEDEAAAAAATAEVAAEAAGPLLEINNDLMAAARENSLAVEGGNGQFYVVDWVDTENHIPGMEGIARVYVVNPDGTYQAVDEMSAEDQERHIAAVTAHVENQGRMSSLQTAVHGVFSGNAAVDAAVEAQQAAEEATQRVEILREHASFLRTRGIELRQEENRLTRHIEELTAREGTTLEELEEARGELNRVQLENEGLHALREDIQAGRVNDMDTYNQRMQELGLVDEWSRYTDPQNAAAIGFASESNAGICTQLGEIKQIKSSLLPESEEFNALQERVDILHQEMRSLQQIRSDIMNGRTSGLEAEQRVAELYGDRWDSYKVAYDSRLAADQPIQVASADIPAATAPSGSAASQYDPDGAVDQGGVMTVAFNDAASGIAPDTAPETAPQYQHDNTMRMAAPTGMA